MNYRYLIAGVLIYFVLSGMKFPGLPSPSVPSGPYTGSMTALHDAAKAMDPKDREALSEAIAASGEMLKADQQGLVSTTEELQRYVKAVVEFDYLGVGKPTAKYPAVAKAFQDELVKAIGNDVAPVTPTLRSSVASALTEAGKAVK
jgi:hypothetical protein